MQNVPDSRPASPQASFFTPQVVADPFPLFKQLRASQTIIQAPMPAGRGAMWLVTRMEDAVQVLKDSKRFTVDAPAAGVTRTAFGRTGEMMSALLRGHAMVSVDEPGHTRLRSLVSKAFTPHFIEGLRPRIQHIADELLDRVQPRGEMDIIQDYAYPLPINVISEMLGIPKQDQEQIGKWAAAIASDTLAAPDESSLAHVKAFAAYIAQLVEQKRQHPGNDLTSQLIQTEQAGDRLSEEELLSMIGLLVFAGHETTSNLIGIGTLMLLDHPDQLKKLTADWSLLPSAIEELLRFNGPATMPTPRFAAEDMDFGGQHIQRGDMVMVILTAANRDEQSFSDPDDLDIVRSLNRHIAFGQGIHYCLGAPLARLEGETAFKSLFTRLPDLRLSVPRESITWRNSFNLRGLKALPVAFG